MTNKNWNSIPHNDGTLAWKDINNVSANELSEMTKHYGCEPSVCKHTKSIVFKSNIKSEKPNNYSQLELESRYLQIN